MVRGRAAKRDDVPRRVGGEPAGAVRLPSGARPQPSADPYHKWLLRTVAEVPDRPDDFVDLVRALTIERTPAAAEAVVVVARVPGVAAGPSRLVDPSHAGQRVELART